jgi:hypothetical protein
MKQFAVICQCILSHPEPYVVVNVGSCPRDASSKATRLDTYNPRRTQWMSSKQTLWNNGHCVLFYTGTLENPDRNILYLIDVFRNRSAS